MSNKPNPRLVPSPQLRALEPTKRVPPLPELPNAAELANIIQKHCGRSPAAELLDGRAGLRGTLERWRGYFGRTPTVSVKVLMEVTPNATPAEMARRLMEQEKIRPPATEPQKNPFAAALEGYSLQMRKAAADYPASYQQDVEELLALNRSEKFAHLFGEAPKLTPAWLQAARVMKSSVLGAFEEAKLKPPSQAKLAAIIQAFLALLGQHQESRPYIRKMLWYPNYGREKVPHGG